MEPLASRLPLLGRLVAPSGAHPEHQWLYGRQTPPRASASNRLELVVNEHAERYERCQNNGSERKGRVVIHLRFFKYNLAGRLCPGRGRQQES